MSATAVRIALVTCPPERAQALATALVDARAAACVNIVPAVQSVYRWQGAVAQDAEALLIVKFPADGFEHLLRSVLAHHPYELPEIVAVDLAQGHPPYLAWVIESCR